MTRFLGSVPAQRWTPGELGSALTVWYDAADAATVTLVSGKVSQINDKSGNARHATQSTAGTRPVIAAAVQNGLDALRFHEDGTTDWLSVPSTGVSAQPYTLFSALKFNDAAASEHVFMNSNAVTFQDGGDSDKYTLYAGQTLDAGTVGNWAVFGGTYNGASSTISVNGTATTGNAGTNVISGATTRIGQRTDAIDAPFKGWLGEFMIVNGSLSTANRERIEGYLAWKWGLVGNLPSGHAYKSQQP